MTTLSLYVACSRGRRPTGTPNWTCGLPIQQKAFLPLRQAIRIVKSESLDRQVQDLTALLESLSSTQRQGSEREIRADWYPQQWESWQDDWWQDQKWTQVSAASSWWDDAKIWDSWQDLYRWADPSVCTSRKWDISEPPAFPGFTVTI